MNDFRLLPDDAKLTAYALGELDGDERVAVERMLEENPKARASVEEIRALATELGTLLESEPIAPEVPSRPTIDPYGAAARKKSDRFPQIIYVFGGLAAACVAVMLGLHEAPVRKPSGKTYYEIELPASEVSLAAREPGSGVAGAMTPDAGVLQWPNVGENASAVAPEPFGLLEQSKRLTQSTIAVGSTEDAASWPDFQFRFKDAAALPVEQWGQRERSNGRTVSGNIARDRIGGGLRSEVVSSQIVLAGFNRSRAPAVENNPEESSTGSYAYRQKGDFIAAQAYPVSTFPAEIDTTGYADVRRFLERGQLPPVESVHIEEMVNYFPYRYEPPRSGGGNDPVPPFAASMEVAAAPWAPEHRLVRIGLKGREAVTTQRAAANLVFLVDVSASMKEANGFALVQESLRILLVRLRPDDRVAIVANAGGTALALPSTPVAKAREIITALDELRPGGATNGVAGIHLAYDIASANFVQEGINRVILCTAGDLNVGLFDEGELMRLVEGKAKSGVGLTVLGFGRGNGKLSTLQRLTNLGNGHFGQVDSPRDAEKLLEREIGGPMAPIATDVKLQVEFNPEKVASYRLIGYENRLLHAQTFDDDTVDAGEIGAGHSVTALYEIIPVDTEARDESAGGGGGKLKYARVKPRGSTGSAIMVGQRDESAAVSPGENADDRAIADELLTLTVRYIEPSGEQSRKLEFALVDEGRQFAQATDDFKFAAGVAGFGMLLRDSPHKGSTTIAAVRTWAESRMADDPGGYRAEFADLLRRAEALQ